MRFFESPCLKRRCFCSDLPARARAVERKLAVIRETADTVTDLIATRTGHRLEILVIGLIAIEIALALFDRIFK